jgi:hypothetical protein
MTVPYANATTGFHDLEHFVHEDVMMQYEETSAVVRNFIARAAV